MISRTIHRIARIILLLVAIWLVLFAARPFQQLPKAAYLTGWFLFLVMIVLTLYNGRKKIPFLPLATSKGWLQFHIYAGYFTLLLFLLHIRNRWPTGWLEGSLACLYALVMLSGVVGIFISRVFPKRLTTRGGEVIFEKIPTIRRDLREKAEAIALKSVADAQASTLADFYTNELADFFSGPRNFWRHVLEGSPLTPIRNKIEDLNRFLNEKERVALGEIADLVRQKDGLDYHFALQMTLKLWLFVHIPLTYGLLILSVVHLILVYAFAGGAG